MPLRRGSSKQAFGQNVSTEMGAGAPQKQALAIAFNMQRRGAKGPAPADEGPSDPPDVRTEPQETPTHRTVTEPTVKRRTKR